MGVLLWSFGGGYCWIDFWDFYVIFSCGLLDVLDFWDLIFDFRFLGFCNLEFGFCFEF